MDLITPADERRRCVYCTREIDAWDLPRYACSKCQQRTAERLAGLPALYAALDASPAGRTGSAMVGSRHDVAGSTVPLNLHVVDLTSTASRDSVLMKLATWAEDWAHVSEGKLLLPQRWDRDDDGAPRDAVTALCEWLRWNLDWACRQHPAVDDFVREIGRCYGQVRTEATGESGGRVVERSCPCGGRVPVRLGDDRLWCRECGAEYGWSTITGLPAAPRTRAVAVA